MLGLLGLLPSLLLYVAAATPLPPLPTGQSLVQKQITTANNDLAKVLSPLATSSLLSLMSTPEIHTTLTKCCGTWANATPSTLLTALTQYILQAEIVHNFEALPPPPSQNLQASGANCLDLSLASNQTYLPNLWQVEFENNNNNNSNSSELCSNPSENNAETTLFHFPDFTSSKNVIDFGENVTMPFPSTYKEASLRPVYAALNLLRVDSGSGNFGSIGLVLNRSIVNPMLLLSPSDTGAWECCCNSSAPTWLKKKFAVNCTSWPSESESESDSDGPNNNLALGSALYFEHTLLTHLSSWLGRTPISHLSHLLSRAFGVHDVRKSFSNNITMHDQLKGYIEADVVGVISFPSSVSMVIGQFRELFGTSTGSQLQKWCRAHHWPLVWALGGLGKQQNATSFRGLDRIVDVQTLNSAQVNRTAAADTVQTVNVLWNHVQAIRSSGSGGVVWDEAAESWFEKLGIVVGESLVLNALPGGTICEAQCIGVDRYGDCVCPTM